MRQPPPPAASNGAAGIAAGFGGPPLTIKRPPASDGKGGWKMRMTVDGGEYYHNVITDAVSWDKPLELQSVEERATDSSDCVWMPDAEGSGGWVPAHVLSRTAKGAMKVRPVSGGKEREIGGPGKKGAGGASSAASSAPIYPLKLSHLQPRFMQPDLVLLESLDPPLIAYCLRHRFEKDQIYTWVGADQSVLVSINPFKRHQIYIGHSILLPNPVSAVLGL